MSEKLDLTFSGLWTSSNPFSKAPDGAAEVADNVVIKSPALVQPRRGYAATAQSPGGAITRTFSWSGRLMAFHLNGDLRDFSDGTGWSAAYDSGTGAAFQPPDASNPIRTATAQRNFFFTTAGGICGTDALGGSAGPAGLPAPLPRSTSIANGSGTNPIATGNSCAYRAVFCRIDANSNLVQSAPSDLFEVDNGLGTDGQVSVQVSLPRITSPASINQAGTFVQLYRTFQVATGTSTGDECFLVQEYAVQDADIANGYVAFQPDQQTDDFLKTALYTNAITAEGLGAANYLPPLARDICFFGTYLLAVNTQERHTLNIQLIGTQGLTAGTSTVVLAGVTYSAVSSLTGPNQFVLHTGGTPAKNIQQTAQALVTAINLNSYSAGGSPGTPPIQAFYTSGPNDAPGLMSFQEIGIGGAAFTFNAGQDGQTSWSPDSSKAAYVQTSTNNRTPGKLWWSNDGIPWGFGPNNYAIIGAAEKDILRAVLVRQTVFLFKTDGLYTLTQGGVAGSPFTVQPFDPGLILLAPETACVVDNRVFCFTNRGAVYVTEAGVSPAVSAPIELDLGAIQNQFTQYASVAFGVPAESDGRWLLALPAAPADVTCAQQFCFDTQTPNWTRWLIPNAAHGCFDAQRQTLAWAVGSVIWQERKTYTSADFQDPTGAFTSTFKLLPISCGDPTVEKQFDDVLLSFRRAEFSTFSLGFDTEKPNVTAPISRPGPYIPPWGLFPWGLAPWGQVTKNFIVRVNQPQGTSQAVTLGLTVSVSQTSVLWQLQGASVHYTPSTATPRR